jgi:MFS family permease
MSRRAYAVIIAGFFTVSISYAIRYAYGMLLPEMLPALNISKTQAGLIFAAYFLVYTIGSPILGALSDRYNYRVILPLFTVILACGTLLMASATTLLRAAFFYSIAALGHAACWVPVSALVQKWVPDTKRGAAMSAVSVGVGLGISLWSVLLPALVASAGWRAGWLCLGAFCLVVAALNLVLVRNPENPKAVRDDAPSHPPRLWASYREIVGGRLFWIIGTAYLLVGFNVLIPYTFLPVYARDALQLSYPASTRFVGIIALCGVAGQLTLGPLSDRVGRLRVMIICGLVMGLGCLAMALARNPSHLYAATAFYGCGYGAVWPVYAAAASDFFPKDHTGGVVGLWTFLLGLGSIFSPVICGLTIDVTGEYRWALLLGLLSGILSGVLLFVLNARRRA